MSERAAAADLRAEHDALPRDDSPYALLAFRAIEALEACEADRAVLEAQITRLPEIRALAAKFLEGGHDKQKR